MRKVIGKDFRSLIIEVFNVRKPLRMTEEAGVTGIVEKWNVVFVGKSVPYSYGTVLLWKCNQVWRDDYNDAKISR